MQRNRAAVGLNVASHLSTRALRTTIVQASRTFCDILATNVGIV